MMNQQDRGAIMDYSMNEKARGITHECYLPKAREPWDAIDTRHRERNSW